MTITAHAVVGAPPPAGFSTITDAGTLRFFARPSQLTLTSGNGQQIAAGTAAPGPLIVQVIDAAGNPFARGFPVAFAVVSGPPGTTVSPDTVVTDSMGFAQASLTAGPAAGAIQVSATGVGLSGSPVLFTATALAGMGNVASIDVTPDSAVAGAVGDSVAYMATCQDSTSAVVTCGSVAWMSLTPAVASMDTAGYAHALAPGVAEVVGAAGGVADTAKFVVNGIGSLSVSPLDTVVTAIGDTAQMSVSGNLVDGGTVALPTDTVVWQSLTPAVVLVDAQGIARIVGAGNGTVQATLSGAAGTGVLRVQQAPVSFTVTPATVIIGVGGQANFTGRTFDRRGFPIPGRTVSWMSLDPTIADVDMTGRVTGVRIGGVLIEGTDSTFADSAFVDVVAAPPQVIQWGADSIGVGRGATLQQAILLSVPPTSNVVVDIVSSDRLILKPTTPTVTFFQGQTNRTVTFQGRAAGRVTVTATDQGALYAPDTAIVDVLSTIEFRNVSNPTVRATSFSLNSAESRRVLVFLSDPAPPAGLAVTIETLDQLVSVGSPTTVLIPGGQLSAEADLQGTGVGSTTLTPTAAGFVGLPSTVTTFLAQFTVTLSSPFVPRVGVGQYAFVRVNVPNRMDRGTLVDLATTVPGVGQVPDSLTVRANVFNETFTYTGLQTGLDTITANRSGWVEGRLAMTVTTPRVRPRGFGTLTAGGPPQFWTVDVLDSVGTGHRRVDSLTVTVTSRDSAVAAVDVPTGIILPDNQVVSAGNAVRPVGGGMTYIVATAPGHLPDSVQVTVQGPKLSVFVFSPGRTGTRQTIDGRVQLPFSVPMPLTVDLTMQYPDTATAPASVSIPANQSLSNFTITGVAPGRTSIFATASGYEPDTTTVLITTNRLFQSSLGNSYFLTTGSDAFTLRTGDQFGSLHPSLDTVTITLDTSDPSIFTIDSATVTVPAGQITSSTAVIQFADTGQAWVRWSAPNHLTDSMSVTVNPSALTLTATPGRVGEGQYLFGTVRIPSPNGLPDTVDITLTHLGIVRGTVPGMVEIPPPSSQTSFQWDGTVAGRDTIVANATSFIPDTISLWVTRPHLFIRNLPASVVVDDTVFATVYPTDSLSGNGSSPVSSTIHPVTDTLLVTVTSTNPMVLAVDSTPTWRINPGGTVVQPRIIVAGPGSAQIIVNAPGNYKPDTTAVTVATAPAITILPSSLTLGTGQQSRSYRAIIPNGVATVTRVGLGFSAPGVAGFDNVLAGDTVEIPVGQTTSSSFTVFAQNQVASVNVTAGAPGFTGGTSVLIVNNPQLSASASGQVYVGQGAGSGFLSVSTRDETGSTREVRNPLAVTLTSDSPAVLTVDSATITVPSSISFASGTFTPVAAGTARIVMTAPGYTPDTTALITVSTPQVTLNAQTTVGVGQQYTGSVSIPFGLPASTSLIVTLTNDKASALTAPDTLTINQFSSFRSFVAVGAAAGIATLQATAPGFTASAPVTTVVGTPVLVVNGPTSGTVNGSTSISISTRDQANFSRAVDQQLTVTLMVDDDTIANFGGQAQMTVTVSAGSSFSNSATLNYVGVGTVNITATASGYTPGMQSVTVNP